MYQGLTFVICAPSGAGKSTLAKMLIKEFSALQFSISCTTRPMRPGEINGKDYFFIDRPEFEKKIKTNEFLEWAEVHGNFYGTPKTQVYNILSQGKNILFDIDIQGASNIKIHLPDSHFIFIIPPSFKELEKRLTARGQDDQQTIKKRIKNAENEIHQASWFDSLIINDDLDKAYDRLRSVYIAATLAPSQNSDILNKLLSRQV